MLTGDASLVMATIAKTSVVHVFGDDNELTANKATVYLARGAELDLAGTGDKVTLTGDGTLDAEGSAYVIDVYGISNAVTIDLSVVNERGLADLTLSGDGNTLKITKDNSPLVTSEQLVLGYAEWLLQAAWIRHEQVVDAAFSHDEAQVPNGQVAAELTGTSTASAGFLLPVV